MFALVKTCRRVQWMRNFAVRGFGSRTGSASETIDRRRYAEKSVAGKEDILVYASSNEFTYRWTSLTLMAFTSMFAINSPSDAFALSELPVNPLLVQGLTAVFAGLTTYQSFFLRRTVAQVVLLKGGTKVQVMLFSMFAGKRTPRSFPISDVYIPAKAYDRALNKKSTENFIPVTIGQRTFPLFLDRYGNYRHKEHLMNVFKVPMETIVKVQ